MYTSVIYKHPHSDSNYSPKKKRIQQLKQVKVTVQMCQPLELQRDAAFVLCLLAENRVNGVA